MRFQMPQKWLNLIIGITLSVIAVVLLNIYLTKERIKMTEDLKRAFSKKYKNLRSVIVAKKDIPAGVEISPEMLETKIVPSEYIQPKAITSLDKALGRKTLVLINKGEQLSLNKLVPIGRTRAESLAMVTPVGKRAITVNVDSIGGLSGMIKPGDYVDIVVLLPIPAGEGANKQKIQVATIPLFQKVLVLAVGSKFREKVKTTKKPFFHRKVGKESESKMRGGNLPVTLALSPQEASLLSFVAEQGRIRLLLRSPLDTNVQPLPSANWETFFNYVNSLFPPKVKSIKQQKRIEIYRGLKKDYIVVSE